MELYFRFLFPFVFLSRMTFSNVFGALPDKMSELFEDASDITWAHAVNSWDALEKALESSVHFLEADVLLGHLKGNENVNIPIMAHPPNKSSDLSLDKFMSTVVERGSEKGIKLDFKSLEVLEPSMQILEKYGPKLNSSVWLNADVLPGPIKSPVHPVPVEQFLVLSHQYFPNATLSIGWTTLWLPTSDPDSWHYEWGQVRKMVDAIRCRGYEDNYPQFTFPVRAIFASRSIKQLQWLLSVVPHSSLTVWSGKFDPLEVNDLLRIRSSFPKHSVFYDVPEPIASTFNAKKNKTDTNNYVMSDNDQWMTITHGQGDNCSVLTYVKNDTIFFGKSLTTVVLLRNVFSLTEESNFDVSGRIEFLGNVGHPYSQDGFQELKLVAVDVSLFRKNMSGNSKNPTDLTTSDTDVILSAVNSSVIYTFQHAYSKIEKFCHIFKLDASADKSFEAWTVSCEDMQEEKSFDELSESGIPKISPRKRLVLPKGPFMFGFVSTGEEYVVVHDLSISSQKRTSTSGSKSTIATSLAFLTLVALCTFSLFE